MIQPVKLDAPATPRDSVSGDSRDSGFSSMLDNLVKPGSGQARTQAPAPRERAASPRSRENAQDSPQSSSARQADASEGMPRPRSVGGRPEGTPATAPSNREDSAPDGTQGASQGSTASADQAAAASQTTPSDPGDPEGVGKEASSTHGRLGSDQGTATEEGQSPAAPDAVTNPMALLFQALGLSQEPTSHPSSSSDPDSAADPMGTPKGSAAAANPQAILEQVADSKLLAGLKATLAKKALDAEETGKAALESQDSLSQKSGTSEGSPTIGTAAASLGLKQSGANAALAELLSRSGPSVETPSVIQTIQEARNAGSVPQLTPASAELPKTEASHGNSLFQGSEAQSAPETPTPSPGNIPAAFSLNAPTAVQAKTSAPEAAAARPSLPMEQMEGTVRWILKNDQNSAELQLRPESLGKVQIQLKVEGNQVHAKVWASEPSTVPLLESHRGMLESSLREQGLSLGSFDLHQGHGSSHNPMEQAGGQASFTGPVLDLPQETVQETPVPIAPASLGNRRVEVFA